ncbi:MAG: MarR family transcriptional regulator [Acidobacteria bacterium]|nr:MarR family transcriptional regulator [Acidobacteriota bacterium]
MNKDYQGVIGLIAVVRERANSYIEDEIRKRDMEGIVPAHGSVLNVLFNNNNPLPIKDIVTQVGRVKSTVTGIINTLEKYGYIRKYSDSTDARVILISLTAKGKGLEKDFQEISESLIKRTYSNFNDSEKTDLIELLNKVARNLG